MSVIGDCQCIKHHIDCIKDLAFCFAEFQIGLVHVPFSFVRVSVCHSLVINMGDFALEVIKC